MAQSRPLGRSMVVDVEMSFSSKMVYPRRYVALLLAWASFRHFWRISTVFCVTFGAYRRFSVTFGAYRARHFWHYKFCQWLTLHIREKLTYQVWDKTLAFTVEKCTLDHLADPRETMFRVPCEINSFHKTGAIRQRNVAHCRALLLYPFQFGAL